MQSYKNLYILGTSHISPSSIKAVKSFIEVEKPGIIAVELDKKRAYAIFQKQRFHAKDLFRLGPKGFIINFIGYYIEKKLGKLVGVSPGSEMKQAISLAKKHNLMLALIDQDIGITINRLKSRLTWKEKFKFFKEIIKGLITKKSEMPKFDLRKVPSERIINIMLNKVKEDYPSIYKTLITERNILMAKNLFKLMDIHQDKKIFAIVGAGHVQGILKIIKGK